MRARCCPPGVSPPQLSPLSSSMEYLLHFGFTSERLSPLELRDLVRWTIKPQILAVPGVAQAQIFGGDSRERQLWLDPAQARRRRRDARGGVRGGAPRHADDRRGLSGDADASASCCRHRRRRLPWRRSAQTLVTTRGGVPVRIGDVAADAGRRRRRASATPSSAAARGSWWRPPRSSAPTPSTSRAISSTAWRSWPRHSRSTTCSTTRRCCGPRVSSRAPSPNCATRS